MYSSPEPEYDGNSTGSYHLPPSTYGELPNVYIIAAYVRYVIDVIGLIGNVTCVAVMTRKSMRQSQFALYTGVLAVSDSAVLVRKLLESIETLRPDVRISRAACGLSEFLFYFCSHFSSWSLVLLTCERFIAVMFPFDVNEILSRRKAVGALLITGALLVLINVHILWTIKLDSVYAICYWVPTFRQSTLLMVYTWAEMLIFSVIPLLVILSLNCIIIYKLCRRKKLYLILLTPIVVLKSEARLLHCWV